jgi:hypothetical protein
VHWKLYVCVRSLLRCSARAAGPGRTPWFPVELLERSRQREIFPYGDGMLGDPLASTGDPSCRRGDSRILTYRNDRTDSFLIRDGTREIDRSVPPIWDPHPLISCGADGAGITIPSPSK